MEERKSSGTNRTTSPKARQTSPKSPKKPGPKAKPPPSSFAYFDKKAPTAKPPKGSAVKAKLDGKRRGGNSIVSGRGTSMDSLSDSGRSDGSGWSVAANNDDAADNNPGLDNLTPPAEAQLTSNSPGYSTKDTLGRQVTIVDQNTDGDAPSRPFLASTSAPRSFRSLSGGPPGSSAGRTESAAEKKKRIEERAHQMMADFKESDPNFCMKHEVKPVATT